MRGSSWRANRQPRRLHNDHRSSITQTASATITSNNLTLDATGGVGTASQPLNASLTANGVLNVQAGSQGVYLNLGSSGLLGVIDSGGDVVLNATGSLSTASGLAGGTVNVTGNNLTLNSATGKVGKAAAPLVIRPRTVQALDGVFQFLYGGSL